MKFRFIWVLMGWFLTVPAHAESGNVITGAGAHFSWVVFEELKPDLERLSGKTLQLYGDGSIHGVGCNAGIKTALKNSAETPSFGFICCPLDDKEIEEKKLLVHPLALEPLLIITHKSNPVKNLTAQQVSDMFAGRIKNWKEVGGFNKPVVVVARLHCKERSGHWKTILPSAEQFSGDSLLVNSAEDMVKRIGEFPNGIGHIGSAWRFKPDDNVKFLKVNGLHASTENLRLHRYPFFRQLAAVTTQNPQPDLLKIILYAQTSPAFGDIAARYNLLPLNKIAD